MEKKILKVILIIIIGYTVLNLAVLLNMSVNEMKYKKEALNNLDFLAEYVQENIECFEELAEYELTNFVVTDNDFNYFFPREGKLQHQRNIVFERFDNAYFGNNNRVIFIVEHEKYEFFLDYGEINKTYEIASNDNQSIRINDKCILGMVRIARP